MSSVVRSSRLLLLLWLSLPTAPSSPLSAQAGMTLHSRPHLLLLLLLQVPPLTLPLIPVACSAPGSDVGTADTYSIQPLAGQPDTPQATPIAPPPGVSVSQQVSANPYRLGQGGGKRVAYGGGGGGVASYPPRQPAPPTSLPPTTYTPDPAKVNHLYSMVCSNSSSGDSGGNHINQSGSGCGSCGCG